jgi:gamma-glutamylcyclotransferase (GGCT)/AIG2-like uncharacterized protein YtfP
MPKHRRTGDYQPVKSQPNYFVFVYGTLKQGERNHRLLADAEYFGEATTCSQFKMYHVGFPVLMAANGDGRPTGRVRGEVYRVTRSQIHRLDQLESEGRMYKRLPIDVTTDEGNPLAVLAYVGMVEFWHDSRGLGTERGYGRSVLPIDGVINWKGKEERQ